MRFANGLLVRAGHEAECLPFLEINVRGMTEHTEFLRSFLEGRELLEELFFGELPLLLSWVSMKYFMAMLRSYM